MYNFIVGIASAEASCVACRKRVYTTRFQARNGVLDILQKRKLFMWFYRCPTHGDVYHLTNLDKQLGRKHKHPRYGHGPETEALKRAKLELLELQATPIKPTHAQPTPTELTKEERVRRRKAFDKALHRAQTHGGQARRLVHGVSGLPRWPEERRYRRRAKLRRRRHGGTEPRVGLPRGETMTKMLSWANGLHVGFNRRLIGYMDMQELKRRKGNRLRRRNRARENEAVRREIEKVDFDRRYAVE